jgi:hypothetical protein
VRKTSCGVALTAKLPGDVLPMHRQFGSLQTFLSTDKSDKSITDGKLRMTRNRNLFGASPQPKKKQRPRRHFSKECAE